MSISIRPLEERTREFLRANPRSSVYWGTVEQTDVHYTSEDRDEKGYVTQFILNTDAQLLEIHLSTPARVWFTIDREVMVVGGEDASGVIVAQMILFPDSRQVLELVKDRKLYRVPIALMFCGLLLVASPFRYLIDFLNTLVPVGFDPSDLGYGFFLLGILGIWLIFLYIQEYVPTPITVSLNEWRAIEHLIIPLVVRPYDQ